MIQLCHLQCSLYTNYHTRFKTLGGWKTFLLQPHTSPYSLSMRLETGLLIYCFCLTAIEDFYIEQAVETSHLRYLKVVPHTASSTVQTTVIALYTTWSNQRTQLSFIRMFHCFHVSHTSQQTEIYIPPGRCDTTVYCLPEGTSSSS